MMFLFSWEVSSIVMLTLSSVITLSLFFITQTPHELVRQNKYQDILNILRKFRDKSDLEIQKEVEDLKDTIRGESDEEPFVNKLKKLNKKNLFALWVVFVFFSNLCGINVISTFLLEIFGDLKVSESLIAICYGASEMVFSFLQMLIADKFGR